MSKGTSLAAGSEHGNIHKMSEYQDGDNNQYDTRVDNNPYDNMDPTHVEVSNQITNLQNDYNSGNFSAKHELLGHLKMQTANIDNEKEIAK